MSAFGDIWLVLRKEPFHAFVTKDLAEALSHARELEGTRVWRVNGLESYEWWCGHQE